MEQIVKRESYPNVQAFQKVYNKTEELIIEYNGKLRIWKKTSLEQPKNKTTEKATLLLEGRQTEAKTISQEKIYG